LQNAVVKQVFLLAVSLVEESQKSPRTVNNYLKLWSI
jgi:hypothetical protein